MARGTFQGNLQGTGSRVLEMLTSSKAVTASYALTASRLTVGKVGDVGNPVYFNNGNPVADSKTKTVVDWVTANSGSITGITGSSADTGVQVQELIGKSGSWDLSNQWISSNSGTLLAKTSSLIISKSLGTPSAGNVAYTPNGGTKNFTITVPSTPAHIGAAPANHTHSINQVDGLNAITASVNSLVSKTSSYASKTELNEFTESVKGDYLPITGGTITGDLVVNNNLTVKGTTVSIDAQNLNVKDKLILVASGSNTRATADGAGIAVPTASAGEGGAARIQYNGTTNVFTASVGFAAPSFTGSLRGNVTGTASYATSASKAVSATSASYATNATNATNATSASHAVNALSASHATNANTALTASYLIGGASIEVNTASYAKTSSVANRAESVNWSNVSGRPGFFVATFQTGAFTATSFNPTGSAATIKVPTQTSHISGLDAVTASVKQMVAKTSSWDNVANTASAAYQNAIKALETASVAQGWNESASYYAAQASASMQNARTYATNANTALTQANAASQSAKNAATAANTASGSAKSAATVATNWSLSASNAATIANASASKAAGWATSASNSAASAATYASNASASMQNARTYASNASTAASQATTYRNSASSSAAEADTYKVAASASSGVVYQKAQEASASAAAAAASQTAAASSANNASTYATRAQQSASAAATSATTATTAKNEANNASASAKTYATNASASAALLYSSIGSELHPVYMKTTGPVAIQEGVDEFIEDTRASAVAAFTGVSKDTSLYQGKTIRFRLHYAGASNATLNLTLADGTTTGAIPIYFSNTTRLGTQYATNNVIELTYSASVWKVVNPYTNSNTTYPRAVTGSGTPVTASHIPIYTKTLVGTALTEVEDSGIEVNGSVVEATASYALVAESVKDGAGLVVNTASYALDAAIKYGGHYSPSASGAGTSGSSTARHYVKTISVDGKGHVVGVTTGNETVTNTDRYVNSAAFASTGSNGANGVKMTLTRAGSDTTQVTATIPVAATNAAGVMTGAMVTKLNGIATGATANTGTVTKVSVNPGTGITASVATDTTTPAISISSAQAHVHSNKSVLDGITSTKVSNWDTAATNNHTHANKAFLDSVESKFLPITGGTITGDVAISANKNLTVGGNLYVNGTASYVNTQDLVVKDKLVLLSSGSTTQALADGAGIAIQTASATTVANAEKAAARFQYRSSDNHFTASVGIVAPSFTGSLSGKATSAGSADSATVATGLGVAGNTSASVAAAIAAKWTYNENTIKAVKVTSASRADSAASATSATSASHVPFATFTQTNGVYLTASVGNTTKITAINSASRAVSAASADVATLAKSGSLLVASANADRPVLFTEGSGTANGNGDFLVNSNITFNPSTKILKTTNISSTTITASTGFRGNLTGTASYATVAGQVGGEVNSEQVTWGGPNQVGTYKPIDAALVSNLSANRFAFMQPLSASFYHSTNGGTSWTLINLTESQKSDFFNGNGYSVKANQTQATSSANPNAQLMVSVKTAGHIYTVINKFLIYLSTQGDASCWCTIRGRFQSNLESNTDTWNYFVTSQSVSGWSGWNVINTSITTYGNTKTSQYGEIQFIFGHSGTSATAYSGLQVTGIQAFGGMGWTTPSTLARTGHLYSWDGYQNATFPKAVTASSGFKGNLVGNVTGNLTGTASYATTAGSVTGISAASITASTTAAITALINASGSKWSTDNDRYVATASFASTGSNGANGVKMTLTRRGSDTGTVVATIPVASTTAAGVVTGAQVTSWNGAATNSHTHSNKAVLDGITAAKTASWDAKTSNTGTVTSVRVKSGSAYLTGDTTITTSGTANIDLTAATKGKIESGSTAFGWGNHANAGYLKSTDTIATASYNAAGATALAWITSNSASALKNDTTTYAGHFSPSASGATAKGSTAARTYLKTVSVDGKGHVVGFTTGSETVTNTDTKVTAVGNHYTPAQSAGKAVSAGQVMTGIGVDAAGHVVSVTGSSAITASCLGVAANTSASVAAAINAKWTYNEATIKAVKVTSASRADSAASATSAVKLVGTSGSVGVPVYINAGVPTACQANIVSLPLSSSGATTGTLTLVPGKVHDCGTLTGNLTLALGTDNTYGHEAIYCCTFNMGSTLRTITLPSGVTVMENSVDLDTTGVYYEIIIMNNVAVIARSSE